MKYYCDYCKSYLTHDTLSVRKSHLIGKNHIKLYCDYYAKKAKIQGTFKETAEYVTLNVLNQNAPGSKVESSKLEDGNCIFLPPPPNIASLPLPPPSSRKYA